MALLVHIGRADPSKPMITSPPSLVLPRQHALAARDVGVKPLPKEVLKPAGIELHTSFLGDEGGTTTWKGPDPSWVAVKPTTVQGKPTETVEAHQGVNVLKNAAGGMDILIAPAVQAKLESIAKTVTPCGAAKRSLKLLGRQGPALCGFDDFIAKANADTEISQTLSEPLTDRVRIFQLEDEGIDLNPEDLPGWEGNGQPYDVPERVPDEGVDLTADLDGWFRPAGDPTPGGAGDVLETIVFGTTEEAAAIEASVASGGAGAAVAGTLTAGTFLAAVYEVILEGNLNHLVSIPKSNIHKIKKPKPKDENTTSTRSSSASCAATDLPICDDACKATAVSGAQPTGTGQQWACSGGDKKDCPCLAGAMEITDARYTWEQIAAQYISLEEARGDGGATNPPDGTSPIGKCQNPRTNVATQYFPAVSKAFCEGHFKKDTASGAGLVFDIHGNIISPKKHRLRLRSPPESGPDAYRDYKFVLTWEPASSPCFGGVDQSSDVLICTSAFAELTKSVCGTNDGNPIDRLFKNAYMDIGCGTIRWSISKEGEDPAPGIPRAGPQRCYDPDVRTPDDKPGYPHPDVHDDSVRDFAKYLCGVGDPIKKNGFRGKKFNKDSKKIQTPWNPTEFNLLGPNLHASVEWVDGCVETQEQDLEFPGDPVRDEGSGVTCYELYYNNFKNCNNRGGAGWRQIGCLKYELHAGDANKLMDTLLPL
ncbi:hypothetical protein V8F06_014506, partial [Rhypophila decipiens]